MSSDGKEKSKIEVHSANSWETADLGDQSRNNKFLRLMGAAKKEHHGRFVIGDKETTPSRPKKDEKVQEEELAHQYEQSMEHRLVGGRKGHIGLGFHEAGEDGEGQGEGDCKAKNDDNNDDSTVEKEEETEKEEESSEDKTEKDNDEDGRKEETDKEVRKRESTNSEDDPDHDKKKMKFVKSSS